MNPAEYRTLAAKAMTEAELQAQVVELAKTFGWLHYHTHDSRRSPRGFPDLVLVRDDRLLFSELKSEKGTYTPQQNLWIEKLAGVQQVGLTLWRPSHLLQGQIQGLLK